MTYRIKTKKTGKLFKMAAETKTNFRDYMKGAAFFILWYLSIFAGFFLLVCPILPLAVLSPKKYRRWTDAIFGMWEPFPAVSIIGEAWYPAEGQREANDRLFQALMEICFGTRVILSGDKINPFESSLFIMNHRTRVDWSFLWLGLFHCCQPKAHNIKYVLKAPIMHIPGPGWVMQACSFIFVHRNWEKDKQLLDKMVGYLNDSDQLYQILLFPEGTDLSDNNIQKSHKYADNNNLERYYRVLHPRTTGFVFLARKMKAAGQLKAIYDITVAYPKTMPSSESDLLRGKFPEEVHFHVKRHSSIKIPYQEEDLKNWLINLWREKEQKLQRFYAIDSFSDQDEDDEKIDFDEINVRNGSMTHKHKDFSVYTTTSLKQTINDNSYVRIGPLGLTENKTYSQTNNNCNVYKSKNYRPSHLLYVVLVFWIILIIFAVYAIFSNFYLQLWVFTHCVFFVALSLFGNGFHHIISSAYFYRIEKRSNIIKKFE